MRSGECGVTVLLMRVKRLFLLLSISLFASGLSASEALAVIITYQEGFPDPFLGGTYTGLQDTTILSNSGGSQNQNFGARGDIAAGGTKQSTFGLPGFPRHALVRFDITSLASQLSAINSVTLRLSVELTPEGADTLQLYRLANANAGWIEGTGIATTDPAPSTGMSTWDQRVQGSQNWAGSPGASTAGTDYLTPLISSRPFDGSTAVNSGFDLIFNDVSFIPAWTAGTNAGLFLRVATESGDGRIVFYSSDAPTNFPNLGSPALRPELIIDYTPLSAVPEPGTLLLLGSGLLGAGVWGRQKRWKTGGVNRRAE